MLKFIAKIFGTKSDKDIKRMMPLMEDTKAEGEKLKSISNDELRKKSEEIQHYINQELKNIDDQLAELHKRIADQPDLELSEKEFIFAQIDKIEKVLVKVLPLAFAVVRETARRFKENEYLEVSARDFDIAFAAKFQNVK